MSHTLGPWVQQKGKKSIAIMGPLDRGCREEIARCQSWNSEADARLIAAAPELLEALENLLEANAAFKTIDPTVDPDSLWEAAMEEAKAVVAKAKGKQ